ncbi:AAA family ATPase [Variovorax guangxiensis]|uniref:AAA family ATPase n=1 Tax=Variovorax guangxiensis TaxID=1775474 RepID=A0A502DXH8_9BURK|nr:AAA family ATPase [Variovorax guangxiensis]TPG24860.1 AAA family ATPase [Variovorax ginsengisoli]TPG29112.1 AAA family ATPase [Variovorax guangxiensis]
MIETIHLSGVATYAPAAQSLRNLKEVNYFYGANGSGKTTISRVIADPAHSDHRGCSLVWKAARLIDTLVYNRDFVEENFGGEDIKGVFTVGKRSVEALQEIARLKIEVAELETKIANLRATLKGTNPEVESGKCGELAELRKKLQAKCWQQKVKHEGQLTGALEGYRSDKSKFVSKVLDTRSTPPAHGFVAATIEDMWERAKTIYGPSKAGEALIPLPSSERLLALESSSSLAKVVVGKRDVDVAALIEKLGNSDWVKQGQPYLAESAGACPFCQQQLPLNLEGSLSKYFDEAFLTDTAAIAALESNYQREARSWIVAVSVPMDAKHPRVDVEKLRALRDAVSARIDANLLLIATKRREPSRPIALQGLAEVTEAALEPLSTANAAIKAHNATVANLSAEKARLTAQVWRHIVDVELKADLDEHLGKETGLQRAIDSLNEQISRLEREGKAFEAQMKALEKDATSVQPTVDEINRLLASYGFSSFSIERDGSHNRYRLRRADGSSARKTLSEGERTFITFLYFYFLAQGSASETGTQSDRVVVLDDPVSSLDSDVLFIVSSLIHNLIESIKNGQGSVKQLFLLTHNVHFHKEVSFDTKRGTVSLANETFWVVRKVGGRSLVEFHNGNPVSSSYEMLWAELRRQGPPSPSIQNTLRRILETYFRILGGWDLNKIWLKFEPTDQPICKSLFSWVNAGSHGALDDLHLALDESSIQRYLAVFKEVFRVSEHLPHYNMMMRETMQVLEESPAALQAAPTPIKR